MNNRCRKQSEIRYFECVDRFGDSAHWKASEKVEGKARKDEEPEFTYVNEDFESFFNAVIGFRSRFTSD
ncbi:hypothetical protein C1H71_16050 [Iodobacter fluviatilis]|uniref:Uncharacterized protein n=1 Tax=Iodobacter fluviatilis TaxID=537 RepID=A0A7G3GDY6_9NEIS|nr:hypothetical protein C1H71_16050 [Iodobacter fluviatilis]